MPSVLLTSTVPSYAGGGYGPPGPPGPPGVPGGFERDIVAVRTVGGSGGTLSAGLANGVRITITVLGGTFSVPVQVAVTAPPLFELNGIVLHVGTPKYYLEAAFGLLFSDQNGRPVIGQFSEPVDVVLNGPGLGVRGEELLQLTSGASATVLPASLADRSLSFSLRSDPDLLVANPSPPSTRGRHSPPPPVKHRHGA